jgi:hypothetical protein
VLEAIDEGVEVGAATGADHGRIARTTITAATAIATTAASTPGRRRDDDGRGTVRLLGSDVATAPGVELAGRRRTPRWASGRSVLSISR